MGIDDPAEIIRDVFHHRRPGQSIAGNHIRGPAGNETILAVTDPAAARWLPASQCPGCSVGRSEKTSGVINDDKTAGAEGYVPPRRRVCDQLCPGNAIGRSEDVVIGSRAETAAE